MDGQTECQGAGGEENMLPALEDLTAQLGRPLGNSDESLMSKPHDGTNR